MGIGTMARWSCRAPSLVFGSKEGARFDKLGSLGHGTEPWLGGAAVLPPG
jgi:hypothetical protein